MKNSILKIFAASAFVLSSTVALAAPPKLMIVPDKTWCISKGYVIESERNGKKHVREDYDRALYDSDFQNVRLAIAQLMAERNFPLVDAASQQEADDDDEMLDEAFEGAQSGAGVETNAYDEILKRAKPDIILKLGWNVNTLGSIYNADYRLEAVDTYSNKSVVPIAGQTGDKRRSIPLSAALKSTASSQMDNFCRTLQEYFDDVQNNGREIRLDVRIVDNGGPVNMNTEFGGKELQEIIYDWVHDNTVNHQFSQRNTGRTMARYDQVRIPLRDASGRQMDASIWVKGLQQKLKSLGIVSENRSSALGLARLYIGEK